ncbi:MAG TPA: hypothetical protein VFC05_02745 [Nitrososphaeraceae archaeon]|nr:hypothetical protein [Nitrososphaeraceae archaeon]
MNLRWKTDEKDTRKGEKEGNIILSKILHLQEGKNNFLKIFDIEIVK